MTKTINMSTMKSLENLISEEIVSETTNPPLNDILEPAVGNVCKGQLLIIKLFDHDGVFKTYDVARDQNSIISLGCKDKEGRHREYDLCPVHKAGDWAKRWGFRVEIESRPIEFSCECES